MPEMDGREAARAIRLLEGADASARVPIVALTAHAMKGDEAAVLAAGIDRYLTKPLRKSAIAEMIATSRPAEADLAARPDADPADATPKAVAPADPT